MELYVRDTDFNIIDIVDDFESLIWCSRYNDIGAIDLQVPATSSNVQKLNIGNYLTRDDDSTIFKITAIEINTDTYNGNTLIIGGVDIKNFFSQRVVERQVSYITGTSEQHLRSLITSQIINPTVTTRAMNIALGTEKAFSITTPAEQYDMGTTISEVVMNCCKSYGWGWTLTREGNSFQFNLTQGILKTNIVFSPDYENISSTKLTRDVSNYKNAVLVGGEGDGVLRKYVWCGSASGIDRVETFVNASSSKSDSMTGDQYLATLTQKGLEEMATKEISSSFESDVDATALIYKTDYNLGDLVTIDSGLGTRAVARITEVTECWDKEGYTITPIFDETATLIPAPEIEIINIPWGKRITFTSPDQFATVRWTTDGTEPTSSSSSSSYYEIKTPTSIIFKAKCFKAGIESSVSIKVVTVSQSTTPTATAAFNTNQDAYIVTFNDTCRYTIDGSVPTESGTAKTAANMEITSAGSYTLKLRIFKDGEYPSEVATYSYTLTQTDVPTMTEGTSKYNIYVTYSSNSTVRKYGVMRDQYIEPSEDATSNPQQIWTGKIVIGSSYYFTAFQAEPGKFRSNIITKIVK